MPVKTTFDPAKDVANIAKHGVSQAAVAELEWESAVVWPDLRKGYGERRIISLRKANNREVRRYAEA